MATISGGRLLDATPDATLIVAGTGEIVFVNDHAGELFGFELAELLGRVVDDLLPEALRAVHRAHRTRFRVEPTVRAMGAGLELLARRSDGSEFPVEISLSPLHLDDDVFVVAAVRDVTERVAAEDQLHRVLATLDATDDAVFIFDPVTLRFSFVNEGAVRLVGYRRDELLTMTPLHLNPYTTESEYRRLVEELFADGASSLVRRSILLAKDGSEVPVEKSFHSATSGRDDRPSVITLARDITERLAAEAELRQSQEALRQAEQVLAVADDRERIARDLHDTVIQRLFAEGLSLQGAIAGVGDPQRTRARLESAVDGLDQTIKELRTAVFSLQGAASAPGGLRGRLLELVTEAADGLGFEPRLQFDGPIETMDVRIADHLRPGLAGSAVEHRPPRPRRPRPRGCERGRRRHAHHLRRRRRRTRRGAGRSRAHQHGQTGPRPRRRLHHHARNLGRFPAHLAGAGRTVTPADMTRATATGVRLVCLSAR